MSSNVWLVPWQKQNRVKTTTLFCYRWNWPLQAVIRFVGVSAKFGTCTVVSVYWTFVSCYTFKGKYAQFSFIKCAIYCTLTTVLVPNLSLTQTKRITVYTTFFTHSKNEEKKMPTFLASVPPFLLVFLLCVSKSLCCHWSWCQLHKKHCILYFFVL
jgi:hypothetical protein